MPRLVLVAVALVQLTFGARSATAFSSTTPSTAAVSRRRPCRLSPRGASSSDRLWEGSQRDALNLLNSPLFLQLLDGSLPAAGFKALLQERCDILRGCHASLEAGAAAASDGGDGGWTALLEASASVLANAEIEGKAWQDLAEGELPQEKLAEGEVCYTCGGDHSNRDCWLERRTRSPAASAFINSLKQRSDPAPSAAECLATAIPWYRFNAYIAQTYEQAFPEIFAGGGSKVGALFFQAHGAPEWTTGVLARAEALLDGCEEMSPEVEARYLTVSSLLYNMLDSEAQDMGLRGTADDLESLRKRLDAVAPGFLQAQDKMAAFQDRLNAAMAYKKK